MLGGPKHHRQQERSEFLRNWMKDGAPGVTSVRGEVVKEEAAVVDRGLSLWDLFLS